MSGRNRKPEYTSIKQLFAEQPGQMMCQKTQVSKTDIKVATWGICGMIPSQLCSEVRDKDDLVLPEKKYDLDNQNEQ